MQTNEYRLFGPPGTGKTTSLTAGLQKAVSDFGASKVMACSLTRTAAAELAGRDTGLPEKNIGTLHSFCYRAIGGGTKVAETLLDEFGKDCKLKVRQVDIDDLAPDELAEPVRGGAGTEQLQRLNLCRVKMLDRAAWPRLVQEFAIKWQAWKDANGLIDFTDMLEIGLNDMETAPGEPAVIVGDEAQDFSRLSMAVLRKWGRSTVKFVMAGDDDQAIFRFAGADSANFLADDLPPERVKVLAQSYRVPRAIHAMAERWIRKVTKRQAKEYRPREAEGTVTTCEGTTRNPDDVLRAADKYLEAGKRVMFLTSCSYMLEPLMDRLRQLAVPYHNPYRRKRQDWNPLAGGGKQVRSTDRVLAFLRPDESTWGADTALWTNHELRLWGECLRAKGLLRQGAKEWLETLKGDHDPCRPALLASWMEPEAFAAIERTIDSGDWPAALRWWLAACLPDKQKRLAYAVEIAARHGGNRLVQDPQVIVGTIHSVKGGEADVVFLYPDLSTAGMREWCGTREEQDSITRAFYVGMTRARETLVICRPSGCAAVPIGN